MWCQNSTGLCCYYRLKSILMTLSKQASWELKSLLTSTNIGIDLDIMLQVI